MCVTINKFRFTFLLHHFFTCVWHHLMLCGNTSTNTSTTTRLQYFPTLPMTKA